MVSEAHQKQRIDRAFEQPVSGNRKLLLLYFAFHADEQNHCVFETIDAFYNQMKKYLLLDTEQQVNRLLHELTLAGWLGKLPSSDGSIIIEFRL